MQDTHRVRYQERRNPAVNPPQLEILVYGRIPWRIGGAHSYIGGRRRSNETDLNKYVRIAARAPERGKLNGIGPCTVWSHKNTKEDEMSDYVFTGLRKVSGIKLSDFKERFGTALCEIYADPVIKHKKTGLLEIDPDNDRLSLTLNGMDLFNRVLIDFI